MSERPNGTTPGADASAAESLPVLVSRLGEDLSELVDSKLSLLKLELQEDVRWYARSGAVTVAGGVVAAIGVGLLSAAAAFFVATLMARTGDLSLPATYSLGFASVGLLFLLGGGIAAVGAARKLTTLGSSPAEVAEVPGRDRRALRPGRP
jgi:hypothetical protein